MNSIDGLGLSLRPPERFFCESRYEVIDGNQTLGLRCDTSAEVDQVFLFCKKKWLGNR